MKNNEIIKTAYEKVFTSCTRDEFINIFLDLLDRCELDYNEDVELSDVIFGAINEGLIYIDDLWEVYSHYCDMGENPEKMYERLFKDIYAVMSEYHNLKQKQKSPKQTAIYNAIRAAKEQHNNN